MGPMSTPTKANKPKKGQLTVSAAAQSRKLPLQTMPSTSRVYTAPAVKSSNKHVAFTVDSDDDAFDFETMLG